MHKIPDHAIKVFDGVLFDVYQRQQELLDGSYTTYEAVRGYDASKGICVIDGKIIVTHEFQPGVEKRSLPGGMNNKGEDSFDAVNREIKEELGYVFGDVTLLVDFPHTAGWFIKNRSYFICRDLIEVGDRHMDGGSEKIEFELVEFDTWLEWTLNGKIEGSNLGNWIKENFVTSGRIEELRKVILG